jgi:hypothetical protein
MDKTANNNSDVNKKFNNSLYLQDDLSMIIAKYFITPSSTLPVEAFSSASESRGMM